MNQEREEALARLAYQQGKVLGLAAACQELRRIAGTRTVWDRAAYPVWLVVARMTFWAVYWSCKIVLEREP